MKVKRFFSLIAAVLMVGGILLTNTACHSSTNENEIWDWQSEPQAESTGVTLNVYNWGEYIDDEVLEVNKAFTWTTGIEVNYRTFDSNEAMYALIASGAADYDVLFPSDYMVGKLREEGLLAKLNFDNIPNFQYIDSLYTGWDFDSDNAYSVPYMWGVTGIFYNTKYVDIADLEAEGWGILWDEKYAGKIFMFDNPRDAFGIAEARLGYSLNTTNEDEIAAAAQLLIDQKPLVQAYVMDQVYDKMINEEGWLAPYYNGDMNIICDEEEGNPDVAFYIPESEAVNFFVDAVCISSSTQHQAEAEAYINFLCQDEVAYANTLYIGYCTPQVNARAMLDADIRDNELFYPSEDTMSRSEVFLTLPSVTNTLMDNWWSKLKQQ